MQLVKTRLGGSCVDWFTEPLVPDLSAPSETHSLCKHTSDLYHGMRLSMHVHTSVRTYAFVICEYLG